jgi:hypothetical protein
MPKLYVPVAVGWPVIVPVVVLRAKPAGRFPHEMEKVYGAVPPLTVNVVLKLTPTSAGGKVPESFSSRFCGLVVLDVEAAPFNAKALSRVKDNSEMIRISA